MTTTTQPIPPIVCLCGSTRFKQQYIDANFRETMAGNIILSVGWFSHADGFCYTPTAEEKIQLDVLHLRKIDLADEILVIDPLCWHCLDCDQWYFGKEPIVRCACKSSHLERQPYIGESTRREICYARSQGKRIRYLHEERNEEEVP